MLKKNDTLNYFGQTVTLTSNPRWCAGGRCVDASWTVDGLVYYGTINVANLEKVVQCCKMSGGFHDDSTCTRSTKMLSSAGGSR